MKKTLTNLTRSGLPRNPSSDSEVWIEENFLPAGLLDTVEEEADEVFDISEIIGRELEFSRMPPKPSPTPVQIHDSFMEKLDDWDEMKAWAEDLGDDVGTDTLKEMNTLSKAIEKLGKDLKKSDSNYIVSFPNVDQNRKRVWLDMAKLKKATEKNVLEESPTDKANIAVKEELIDKTVVGLRTEFEIWNEEVSQIETNMLSMFSDSPVPKDEDVSAMSMFIDNLNKAEKAAQAVYIKLAVEITNYEDVNKMKKEAEMFQTAWRNLQSRANLLILKGKDYNNKLVRIHKHVPTSSASSGSSHRSSPLERLPLPVFKGVKLEFLRFKQEFDKHVKYESEEEKMLALKTKCLLKAADKQRVCNESTLADCWKKLDDEYGDIDTLVADIFTTWNKLKPPVNDHQFIKFIEQIDNGVSCLKALGHEKELDSSYSSVMLENKLSIRLKHEFSKSFTAESSPNKNRMKSLMTFLLAEKKAAHLRSCNYSSSNQARDDPDEEDQSISASTTGVSDRGRGGFRGRGADGRGKGIPGGRGRGQEGVLTYP